jgi:hypothetical protein
MPQIFHHSTNTFAKATIFSALFVVALLLWTLSEINRSEYVTDVGVAHEQPVPFSHQHHVNGLGIDCRYCHTSVEESSFAGIPPTATCMNCHKQIWTNAEMLAPVRESFATGKPIAWRRVNDLPDFVRFDHSIHISKGVGCVSCHGRVDQMPLTWKAEPMTMEWCLNCHRAPEKFVRPREEVFNMAYAAENQRVLGPQLVKQYDVKSRTSCSSCHY